MKKYILILSAIAAVSFAVGFVVPTDKITKDTARVRQLSGLYMFIECQPLAEYEVIGTVKKGGFVWTGKATEMMDIMIRKTHRDYPAADGIIFDDITLDHATVIKFK